jgi:phosphoribosylformylglycinamidine cyclo-ligase
MELYVDPEIANQIINISEKFNVEAKIIGKVEKSTKKKLTIKSQFGDFQY